MQITSTLIFAQYPPFPSGQHLAGSLPHFLPSPLSKLSNFFFPPHFFSGMPCKLCVHTVFCLQPLLSSCSLLPAMERSLFSRVPLTLTCLFASSLGSLFSIMSNTRCLPALLALLGLLHPHPLMCLEEAVPAPARPCCCHQPMLTTSNPICILPEPFCSHEEP